MITRKENLLIRPFQLRKYTEHRQKVITALPRIDDVTPPKRNHVYIKCKKLQVEAERHAQIERDNFILLRHLSDIMKMKRVDNYWLYEHPKFLHRIKLFHRPSGRVSTENYSDSNEFPKSSSKKDRCIACHPENYVKKEIIPEERVPWEIKPVRELHSACLPKRHKETISKENNQFILGRECIKEHFSYLRDHEINVSQTKNLKASIKQRGATAPPQGKRFNKYINKEKLSNDRSLTVIIKFPLKAQVTLDAGMSDKIT